MGARLATARIPMGGGRADVVPGLGVPGGCGQWVRVRGHREAWAHSRGVRVDLGEGVPRGRAGWGGAVTEGRRPAHGLRSCTRSPRGRDHRRPRSTRSTSSNLFWPTSPQEEAPAARARRRVAAVEEQRHMLRPEGGVDLRPRGGVAREWVVRQDAVERAALVAVHVDAKHLAQQRGSAGESTDWGGAGARVAGAWSPRPPRARQVGSGARDPKFKSSAAMHRLGNPNHSIDVIIHLTMPGSITTFDLPTICCFVSSSQQIF